jgi:peptide/nickel transport system substrate-binding protein
MAPDGLSWTFNIKKGIKFHNGDPLKAEDVAFSLTRAILGEKSITMASRLLAPAVKEIVATGPYTVEFRCKEPRPTLNIDISIHSDICGLVVGPKKYILEKGDDYFITHPIGTGPYKFVEQEMGHHIYLEAVDKPHWRAGVPKYKRIEVQYAPEESTRIAKLMAGDVDAIDISRERFALMKKAGYNIFNRGGKYWVVSYHQQWDPKQPVANIKVRKALTLAINRKEILDTLLMGMGQLIPTAPGGKTTLGYDMSLPPHPYDPKQAKRLLAEAGYPDGWKWDLLVAHQAGAPELVRVTEAVAGYWETNLGIKSKIQVMDWPSLRAPWGKKQLVNCSNVMAASYRPTISQYVNFVGSRAGLVTVLDPEIDRLLRIAEGDFDPKKREEAAHKVQLKMYNEYLFTAMFETGDVWATTKQIGSWNMGLIGFDLNLASVYTRK